MFKLCVHFQEDLWRTGALRPVTLGSQFELSYMETQYQSLTYPWKT